MPFRQTLVLALLVVGFARSSAAQAFDAPPVRASSDPPFDQFISSLARQLARQYKNSDDEVFLDNRMRMRIVAGDYRAAVSTAEELSAYRAANPGHSPSVLGLPYEIYAAAKAEQSAGGGPLIEALNRVFADRVRRIDDATAANAMAFVFGTYPGRIRMDLDAAIARANERPKCSLRTRWT